MLVTSGLPSFYCSCTSRHCWPLCGLYSKNSMGNIINIRRKIWNFRWLKYRFSPQWPRSLLSSLIQSQSSRELMFHFWWIFRSIYCALCWWLHFIAEIYKRICCGAMNALWTGMKRVFHGNQIRKFHDTYLKRPIHWAITTGSLQTCSTRCA